MKRALLLVAISVLSTLCAVGQVEQEDLDTQAGARRYMPVIRNNAPISAVFEYSVITDQVVINDRVIRIPALLTLEILDADSKGNIRTRARIESDTHTLTQDIVMFRPGKKMTIVGLRLADSRGSFDATIDAHGRLVNVVRTKDETAAMYYDKTPDAKVTDMEAFMSTDAAFPALFAFVTPDLLLDSILEIGHEYLDTSYTLTQRISIGTSYGSEGMDPMPIVVDTLYRSVIVDSVVRGEYDHRIAYMSVVIDRVPPIGTRTRMKAKVLRDLNLGVVTSITQLVDRVTRDGAKPVSNSTSRLKRFTAPSSGGEIAPK